VDFSPVDVGGVVQYVCDEVRPMLKGRTLKCRVGEEIPPVLGEARKLHQILVNLLNNAIKYSEPGTQITLSARSDQSAVRFEVADQGVGIRKEHLPRLFEKFYRADDPVVRRTSGTGLGLYIVRSLVNMLGGQVNVRSIPGKGTTFVVTLPRADAMTPKLRVRERSRVAAGVR
jgi:signal transduction histidine kinase